MASFEHALHQRNNIWPFIILRGGCVRPTGHLGYHMPMTGTTRLLLRRTSCSPRTPSCNMRMKGSIGSKDKLGEIISRAPHLNLSTSNSRLAQPRQQTETTRSHLHLGDLVLVNIDAGFSEGQAQGQAPCTLTRNTAATNIASEF